MATFHHLLATNVQLISENHIYSNRSVYGASRCSMESQMSVERYVCIADELIVDDPKAFFYKYM